MKTKYILHGGFTPHLKQENDAFFSKILEGTPQELKILLVYFATDNGEKYFPEDIEQFRKNGMDKKLQFEMADESRFEQQIITSDVVYLHGGRSRKILDKMRKFANFPELIKGKVVAADSAGANALSTYFYSRQVGVCEGLGILPIKFIPHFVEEYRDKLLEVRSELETLFLPEYSFKMV